MNPVEFSAGLNVVLAEIRLPENRNRDTHNLGKTTLGRIIDFCLLSGKDPSFFLFKHFDLFKEFVFYIEIELDDGSFITIRRSVQDATKIAFKRHDAGQLDLSEMPPLVWDHQDVPFDRARELLDGLLDWRGLKPWSYRKALGYLLRSQEDYREVFQLRKFASRHADWKPFLAHLLGFDGELVAKHYDKEQELSKRLETAQAIKSELGGSIEDASKIEGMLLLKRRDVEKKQSLLNAFDFRVQDQAKTKHLVDEVDERISLLNAERYSLSQNRKKVHGSLQEDQILFDPDEAERLFKEAGILFKGQVKKEFQQLIDFNRAITDERRVYLAEELAEIDIELRRVNAELSVLGKNRSEILGFLSGTDAFTKYKQLSNEVVALRADLVLLESQQGHLHRLQELRTEIRLLTEECRHLQEKIELDVESQNSDRNSLFSSVRVFFNEIIEEVIDRKALLSVTPNKKGHLEFNVEILDEAGKSTSADLGHTYRKLLCVGFDLAVLRAHSSEKFPRFVYHDGVLESLDDRKKESLLAALRRYTEVGLQVVVTLIDSDLPIREHESPPVFSDDEIVVTLHDEGEDGRLFKIAAW